MAKVDITKRPRRALSAEERQELFREFKLGIFALAALVTLVVTLCWDRDARPDSQSPEAADSAPALVKVVWNPTGRQGGISPDRIQQRSQPGRREVERTEQPVRRSPEQIQPQPQQPPPQPREERTVPQPRREARPQYRNYVVKRHDTLWKIAKVQMGDGKYWPKIREANPSLRNSNRLRPGQVLRIPENLEAATAGVTAGSLAGGPPEGDLLLSSPTQSP